MLKENVKNTLSDCNFVFNTFKMKKFVFVGLLFLSLLILSAFAQVKQVIVPYTFADRNRSIRTDTKLNGLDGKFKSIDARFDNIDKQFIYQHKQLENLKTILYWGFGILISLFLFMLGYMIWDRHRLLSRYSFNYQGPKKIDLT